MGTVEKYYDDNTEAEWMRLERHKIEFDITKRYLDEYVKTGTRVLDIGGGPGRYSLYLSLKGCHVHLLDLSSKNLEYAKNKATELKIDIEKYFHADALHLSDKVNEQYDVILCMGPIYHLPEEADRIKVMKNCIHHLKPGGILIVSFISAYAPIIDILKKYPEAIRGYKETLLSYLKDGRNIVSPENQGFTNAYFMNPNQMASFMSQFDLVQKVLTGIEGISAQSEEKINALEETDYQEWIDLIYETSKDPLTWGACEHFLYIGQKKNT
ncbi:MAG: class I SAM-dependent methyltransferase [Clostridia bacterium]|nr:class I SAM-dependent methyltransferase [Clostridia bacterium]